MECPLRVEEVMSTPAISVGSTASVLEATRIMNTYGISSVVIVEEGLRPIAIFTSQDLVWVVATLGCPGLTEPALKHSNRNLPEIRSDQCIDAAAKLLASMNMRTAPVVDSTGRLVGVVTMRDIAKGLLAKLSELEKWTIEKILSEPEAGLRTLMEILRKS